MRKNVLFASLVAVLLVPALSAQSLFEIAPGTETNRFSGGVAAELSLHPQLFLSSEFTIEFEGRKHFASLQNVEWREGGNFKSVFRVEDSPVLSFATYHQGLTYSMIYLEDGKILEIRPGKNGQEIFSLSAPTLECQVKETHSEGLEVDGNAATSRKQRSVRRYAPVKPPPTSSKGYASIVILYTKDGEVGAGGKTGVEAMAQAGVDYTNFVVANSNIQGVKFSLAGVSPYSGPDYAVTLKNFAESSEAAQARKDFKADIAGLFTHVDAAIATLPLEGKFDPKMGFFLLSVKYPWFTSYFAHEVGHIEGLQHDTKNAANSATDPYPWARGWQNCSTDAPWITIMSYFSACTLPAGQNPSFIPFFSNPNVNLGGIPTGIEGESNNAKMMEIGFKYSSNYFSQLP